MSARDNSASPANSPLGRKKDYSDRYDPALLYPIARADARRDLSFVDTLPFHGEDIWNAYEVSWLSPTGLPCVRLGTFRFPAIAPNLVESKSLKLYLNSLNNTKFDSDAAVAGTINSDLSKVCGADVSVDLVAPALGLPPGAAVWSGWCIDDPTIEIETYDVQPSFLNGAASGDLVGATVYSDLLRTCCPVTGQPDWASVMIRYQGPWIDHKALLRYLMSFRNHADFHEHCVERIFDDINTRCMTQKLSVYARYTRRGGLDINPFRSNYEATPSNLRHERQ